MIMMSVVCVCVCVCVLECALMELWTNAKMAEED